MSINILNENNDKITSVIEQIDNLIKIFAGIDARLTLMETYISLLLAEHPQVIKKLSDIGNQIPSSETDTQI